MKMTNNLKLNSPELSDAANVLKISENFEKLDKLFETLSVKKSKTAVSEFGSKCCMPYIRFINTSGDDITVTDSSAEEETTFVVKSGESYVEWISEASVTPDYSFSAALNIDYFIPTADAIEAGGGASDYSELTNKPKINNVELSGNKSLADIGAGTYSKPTTGIPKTDLSETVQKSLSYVENEMVPQFQRDETAVSCKTVPENVKDFAVVEKIYGKTVKVTPEEGEPYLESAPIECVVSYGKNLCDGIAHDFVNANGKLVDNSDTSYTYVAQCIPGRTYTISKKGGNRFGIITTTDEPKVGTTTVNVINLANDLMTYTYTAGTNEYYLLAYLGFNDSEPYDVQIEEGNIATAYTQFNKTIISVPDEIKNLPDYGVGISDTVRNYVDFESGKYYRKCKTIKVKDITWSKATASAYVLNTYTSGSISDKIIGTRTDIVLMAKYDSKYNKEEFDPTWNKVVYGAGNPANKLTIVDDSITSLADFKTINANEDIIYQLATPEIIDISDIIRPINCEQGGTITLVNEHSFDVANTIIYEREVSEHD